MKEDESNNGLVSNLDSDGMKSFGKMLYLLFSDYLCPNALLISKPAHVLGSKAYVFRRLQNSSNLITLKNWFVTCPHENQSKQ